MSDFSFENYSRAYLKIINKSQKIIPLSLNEIQLQILKVLNENTSKPNRLIILKSRQMGASTLSASYLFYKSVLDFNSKSLIIADDSNHTNNIFRMIKNFYDFLPDEFKPARKYSNSKILDFDNASGTGLKSSIIVETAGKPTAGRSGTIQNLHASEVAFWPNASEVYNAVQNSMPQSAGSLIILESTANGMGGDGRFFYDAWQGAINKDNNLTPLFFPWYLDAGYSMATPEGFKLTDEEMEILHKHNLSKEQIYWRREKIKSTIPSATMTREELFNQEFPTIPEDAFVASGRSLFDVKKILDLIERVRNINVEIRSF